VCKGFEIADSEHPLRSTVVDDYEAIRQLFAEYAHAMDAPSPDGVAELFHPEGTFELLGEVLQGRERIAAMVRQYQEGGALTGVKHITVNSVITLKGDRASAVSDWLVIHADGGAWRVMAAGRYEDELIRSDRWRFSRRRDVISGDVPPEAHR